MHEVSFYEGVLYIDTRMVNAIPRIGEQITIEDRTDIKLKPIEGIVRSIVHLVRNNGSLIAIRIERYENRR